MQQTVFIIDTYNPYSPYNDDVRAIFTINLKKYCIREIPMFWGMPDIGISFDDYAADPQDFRVYDTYEEALEFLNEIKKLNR